MKPQECLLCAMCIVLSTGCAASEEPADESAPTRSADDWQQKACQVVWVAYSPSTGNPTTGLQPEMKDLVEDLRVLRSARFTGLVTYGMQGVVGKELPRLAKEQGFRGLILGIWDPKSKEELAAAKAAASHPVVLGFCVGNEGLDKRYSLRELEDAIEDLRDSTGKKVTTTEEIDDYYRNEALLDVGDWVFPNAHPYFHSRIGPQSAVRWTQGEYDRVKSMTSRFILFKEVGLPTAGDKDNELSEASQEAYYVGLAATDVPFVYFEAFDLTWKRHLPVEPHWGLFRSDRSPKPIAKRLRKSNKLTFRTSGRGFLRISSGRQRP
jgi:exo-beta-1,3-glucanase (GH17 family)